MKEPTERVCPHCQRKRPVDEFRRRGTDDHSVKYNRVGELYGRCETCRHAEHDGLPRQYLTNLLNASRQRRESKAITKITIDHLMHILTQQRGICPITGLKLTFTRGSGRIFTNASIDRINNDEGYTQGNVRLVTLWANLARNTLSDDDLIYYCTLVARRFAAPP